MGETSVDKALALLEALSAEPRTSVGVRQLAERVGLPHATGHRLLQTLLQRGYVRQEAASTRYLLGTRALELGFAALRGLQLAELGRPFLEHLVARCNETASLSVLEGGDSLFVDRVDSRHPLRLTTEVGSRRPAHVTAAGRVLLAYLPPARLAKVVPENWPPYTEHSVTTRRQLVQRLRDVVSSGFAVDHEEWADGVSCAAAPVFGHEGAALAALSVVGPTARMRVKFEPMVQLVVETAAELSRAMGQPRPQGLEQRLGGGIQAG
jgi:IclR family acetate operon transcriptional repressor